MTKSVDNILKRLEAGEDLTTEELILAAEELGHQWEQPDESMTSEDWDWLKDEFGEWVEDFR